MGSGKIGLVLVSHGYFASEALKSAEMIMGHQEGVKTIAVIPGMGLDETINQLREAVQAVKGNEGTVIMTDILGGTPSNAAGILTAQMDDVHVLTGFNMPMLLELLTTRDQSLGDIAENISNIGKQSIFSLTEQIKKSLK